MELKGWFKVGEYPESVINQQVKKTIKKSILYRPKSKG